MHIVSTHLAEKVDLDTENIVCEGAPHRGGLDVTHDTARVVDKRSKLRQSRRKSGQKSAMGRGLGGDSVIVECS